MRNQLKVGAILTYISLMLGNVIALAYTPFMLRMLGQGEYGLYSLANAVVGYLAVLDFGFGSAAIRYTAKYNAEGAQEKAQVLFGMFIVLYALIGVVTLCLGLLLSIFSHVFFANGLSSNEIQTVRKLIFLAAVNLSVSFPFGVFTSIITAYERFVFLKVSSLIRLIVNPLVYIPVLMFGFKSVGLIIAATMLNFMFLIGNFLYCLFRLKIKILFCDFDFSLLKEIFSYSVWVFVGSVVNQLWWNAGQFLLGMFASSVSIAIYSVSMQFKSYFESFATAISGVFLPRMTAMVTNGATDANFSEYFIRVGRLQFIVIALIVTGFILFGKQFITLWAGLEYAQSYYVTLIIFAPLALVDTQTLGITILQAKNRHKFRSLLYLFIACFCIAVSIPFIKRFGVFGCATATALSLTVGNIFVINWYYGKKIGLDIKQFWKQLARMTPGIVLSWGVAFTALRFLPKIDSYRSLLPMILVYCIVYFFVMYFLSFNRYERNLINRIFIKVRKVPK